ncbi:MAG: hypothetical protein COB22_04505 [Cycloclasticus sp.]|nr:MAG: hypothetical protein COB22_04505 [Cycloclasticus sp.]
MGKGILMVLFFVSGNLLAHGNIDNKHGACTLNVAPERGIHLTAYQPSTHEGEVFCQDAPDLVETTIVLDFMEEDSKKLPFSFSVTYMNGDIAEPVSALPLALYPTGSMLLTFMPKAVGKYHGKVMFLDKDGHDTSREFDFYIGQRSPNSSEPSSTQTVVKWLVILLFVFGGAYMLYTKRMNREDDVD